MPDLQAEVFGARAPKDGQILPGWVKFLENPDQSEIPQIYARCDLWLFTSHHEGFGLPLLEAMACRTPVLATRAGAAEDLITGQNGRILDPTVADFVAQILQFADMDNTAWQAFSQAAHQTADRLNKPIALQIDLSVVPEEQATMEILEVITPVGYHRDA